MEDICGIGKRRLSFTARAIFPLLVRPPRRTLANICMAFSGELVSGWNAPAMETYISEVMYRQTAERVRQRIRQFAVSARWSVLLLTIFPLLVVVASTPRLIGLCNCFEMFFLAVGAIVLALLCSLTAVRMMYKRARQIHRIVAQINSELDRSALPTITITACVRISKHQTGVWG